MTVTKFGGGTTLTFGLPATLAIVLVALACAGAWGAEVAERIEQGNELLRKGDAAGAMAVFGELQAEEPNSPEVLFGLGCAQYEEALRQDSPREPEEAAQLLRSALRNFERAEALGWDTLRSDAGYNHANALAQIAKRSVLDQPDEAKKAYEQSIQTYDSFLKRHPGYAPAEHNLDHMRYLLKRLLQEPPPPQPESGQDRQPQRGDQNQERGQGQSQEREQGQQEGDKSEQERQSEGAQDQQPQDSPPPNTPQDRAQQGQKPADRQSIEALLNSLENVDKEEQKRLRQRAQDRRLTEEWW